MSSRCSGKRVLRCKSFSLHIIYYATYITLTSFVLPFQCRPHNRPPNVSGMKHYIFCLTALVGGNKHHRHRGGVISIMNNQSLFWWQLVEKGAGNTADLMTLESGFIDKLIVLGSSAVRFLRELVPLIKARKRQPDS